MSQRPDEPNGPDEEAAWREIVENYGDRPRLEPDAGPGGEPGGEPGRESGRAEPEEPADRDERLRGLFRPSWQESLQTEATWDDEGHFVPPTPPPVPVAAPRRRLAWTGLFGSPLVMLLAVVLGWQLPDWLMLGLAAGFAGGFVYLVATMQDRRPGDGSGDDGAVV